VMITVQHIGPCRGLKASAGRLHVRVAASDLVCVGPPVRRSAGVSRLRLTHPGTGRHDAQPRHSAEFRRSEWCRRCAPWGACGARHARCVAEFDSSRIQRPMPKNGLFIFFFGFPWVCRFFVSQHGDDAWRIFDAKPCDTGTCS